MDTFWVQIGLLFKRQFLKIIEESSLERFCFENSKILLFRESSWTQCDSKNWPIPARGNKRSVIQWFTNFVKVVYKNILFDINSKPSNIWSLHTYEARGMFFFVTYCIFLRLFVSLKPNILIKTERILAHFFWNILSKNWLIFYCIINVWIGILFKRIVMNIVTIFLKILCNNTDVLGNPNGWQLN